MHWKDLSVGRKVLIGMGTAVGALLLVVIGAVQGIGQIVTGGLESAAGNKLRSELLQREVDHLKWAQEVNRFVFVRDAPELKVQLDHTQCGFGAWYYGSGRKEAESLLPLLREPLEKIGEPHRKLHESAILIRDIGRRGELGMAQSVFVKETLSELAAVQDLLKAMSAMSREHILSEEQMLERAAATRGLVLVVGFIAVVAGSLLSVVISRAISGPLKQGVGLAEVVAEGDLDARLAIDRKDEVGDLIGAMNEMVRRLREAVSGVKAVGDHVSTSSQVLSSSAQQISRHASQQAAQTEEASSAIEEMNETIRQNAENARETEQIAQKASFDAEESGKAVVDPA